MTEMKPVDFTDVPSPIDFRDPEQARAWVAGTIASKPWRPLFFAAFAAALNDSFLRPPRVLELGSGPGHLAKHLLESCPIESYTALDISNAMHDLARDHVGAVGQGMSFVIRDFRSPDWPAGLKPIDAVITMQAAHEIRHKARLPVLLAQLRGLIRDGGILLFCDHYAEAGSGKNPDLFPTKDELTSLLDKAGFRDVSLLLDHGGMVLYRAVATELQ